MSLPQVCSVCKRRSDDPATPIKCYTGTYDHQWKNMTTNRDIDQPKEIYKGGAAATKIPGFKYIPLCALERLAKRFELGLERHGKNSWNALNPESGKMLDDNEWLIERLSHVIHHCYKEIEFLTSDKFANRDRDDNAAAIMWGGACLIAADERKLEYVENVGETSPKK